MAKKKIEFRMRFGEIDLRSPTIKIKAFQTPLKFPKLYKKTKSRRNKNG